MKTIKQSYTIHASIKDVWDALVNPKVIDKWGGGPAKMVDKIGCKFSLWGGDIYGKNIEVIKEQKLEQEWTSGEWDEPSIVTFTLHEGKENTKIDLLQKNIPDKEVNDIDDGWKRYYLGAIKDFLETHK